MRQRPSKPWLLTLYFDTERCAYICPHTVELIPLIIGYLLVGEAMATTTS